MEPFIGITMGDPGGIGPEIILKSLAKFRPRHAGLLIIGCENVFRQTARRLRLSFSPRLVSSENLSVLKRGRTYFLDTTSEAEQMYARRFGQEPKRGAIITVGRESRWNACLALSAIQAAARCAAQKWIQGIVTAPVHKGALHLVDPDFVGHTEYLAHADGAREFAMMFVSAKLRVTLVTIHIPLAAVPRSLKMNDIVTKIRLTHEFLAKRLRIRSPRIAVTALNPHGSEFGTEEKTVIKPAVTKALKTGMCVTGPLSGDQVFFDAYEGRYDAVVAMYHDQGLAPFKTIAFREGVNVTLGLSYLRTSPDHGTAFDIARKNKACPAAFMNSLRLIDQTLA